MYLSRTNRNKASVLSALAVMVLAGSAFEARAQRPGTPGNPARDMVRAINRQEMDRLLLLKPLPALKNEPARRMMLKQISDDFRDLQNLNNRMMSETWARESVDYGFVSDMISQIKDRANRLKGNLNLPQARDSKNELGSDPVNDQDFRAALLILDRTIMRFVRNPLFQSAKTMEITQATQARQDLESVIDLTTSLRKVASKLGKAGNR